MVLLERLNDSGALFLSHTKVGEHVLLRMAVGAPSTRRAHVEAAWQRISDEYDAVRADVESRLP